MATNELTPLKTLRAKLTENAGQILFILIMILNLVTNLRLLFVTSEISSILNGRSNTQDISGNLAGEVIDVTWDNAPVRGQKDAPIQIVEFADFQCPFCAASELELSLILKKYDGKVLLAFRHFPLPMHPQAMPAAEASECAREQGKFWEMHDLIFVNQEKLNNHSYRRFAEQLEVNLTQFDICMSEHRYAEFILNDRTEGQSYGVTGTPTFFINGRAVVGSIDLPNFQRVIDEVLSSSTNSK